MHNNILIKGSPKQRCTFFSSTDVCFFEGLV